MTPRYTARRISDPRSRGACYWFEVERVHADGRREFVAVAEYRAEAREIIRAARAHDAARPS